MKKRSVYLVLRTVLTSLLLAALGVLAIFARAYARELFDVLLIAFGIGAVLLALPTLVRAIRSLRTQLRDALLFLIASVLQIAAGVPLLFAPRDSVLSFVLLSALALVIPVLRIVAATRRFRQLRIELPQILLASFLFAVSQAETEGMLCLGFGIALVVIAVGNLVIGLARRR